MIKLKWIESAGGPIIMISDKMCRFWSGIYKRASYLNNSIEEADDFLDPLETDYGKACMIEDYLAVIEIKDENVLVFGDEPMPTTIFFSLDNQACIARWCNFGIKDSEHITDNLLFNFDLNTIENWEFALTIKINTNNQYLFDSAIAGTDLISQKLENEFLLLNIMLGYYDVYTTVYEPNNEMKIILYRFNEKK
jgi:hypothetical protein